MNSHVSAPSNCRTSIPSISCGSKLRALTPSFVPAEESIGSQCVAQPQTLQLIVRIVLGPHMYCVVFSGCPRRLTESDSYNAQSAPLRRQIEQLQSIKYSGFEGTLISTAPQWQVARSTVVSLDYGAVKNKVSRDSQRCH